ncbi:MAG: Lipid-A-disaccharide synthetase, partial [Pseudomonadota bacterium]
LPNILLNEEVAPELIQRNATAEILAAEFIKLFNNKEEQQNMTLKFAQLQHILRQNSNLIAAQAVLSLVE